MGTISLRLEDELLDAVTNQAKALHLSRTEYLRRAIAEMNEKVARDLRRRRLQEASRKVRAESMRVNREFAEIEEAPDA
ncbi:MAG: ribbon-helix-helix protein, CopG family [Desulfurivibrionaceae bacterium]|jgi:predicted transcriptional regulator|nr:ribbon-helix-helix protein, CopG family [Pseudomonadota bacterium]MCG2822981.1 ribbon-helix-helix protein, CopG family [Desulfobulbaceae bacterium]MDP2001649.1 ribbon-helix-helix protein, CopG family [Desulfurivibrionaceae bacterium]PKN23515.1 MAG: CopG family transcriptional regulator [Deltaproteobacteria bacterium HGW-Deltaproteobacteria-3]MBU4229794.1 ribbon-helix-helix protein, CopG family [Pseudomonadota bacterium]